MPWKPSDAVKKNKNANTPEKARIWAKVANEVLERTGDEGRAVREANSVVAHIHDKKR